MDKDNEKQRILCLAPARATPGMPLAHPVRAPDGQTLLTAETVLDKELIERMIQRGVNAIAVRVPDLRDEATIAREMEEIRARIGTIFRGPGSDARNALRDAVLDGRIESAR